MLSTKNKHANWNFCSDFQLRKIACITTIFHTKTACHQPRISMQTGTFCPDFQLRKTACITTIFQTKNCMLSTKNKYANYKFFSKFPAQKNSMHFYHFHTKNCMLSTKKNKHATWIYFLVFQPRKTACTKIQHTTQK